MPRTVPPVPPVRTGRAHADRTPSYAFVPRWGLPPMVFLPPHGADDSRRSPAGPGLLARSAPWVLRLAAGWYLVAAIAHLTRYGVLVVFAQHIAPFWLDLVSVIAVWASGLPAVIVGVCAAVTATEWLVARRRQVFAPSPDPRAPGIIRALCWSPVVNLVQPVVLVRELLLARGPDARTSRWLRIFWAAWVLDWVLLTVCLALALVDGPQAAADRVLVTSATFAVAAVAAWAGRAVMRCLTDTSPRFTRRYVVESIVEKPEPRSE